MGTKIQRKSKTAINLWEKVIISGDYGGASCQQRLIYIPTSPDIYNKGKCQALRLGTLHININK